MPFNPILFSAAGILDLLGLAGLLLTHFGVVMGFSAISPIFFGASVTLYLIGLGMPPDWRLVLIVSAVSIGFFELVFRFNLWGLATAAVAVRTGA